MMLYIPNEAEFITVEFAKVGGGTHKQRLSTWALKSERRCALIIAAAVKGCKRKRVKVANALRITFKNNVLFDRVGGVPEGFR
jgi:hypothetical protein